LETLAQRQEERAIAGFDDAASEVQIAGDLKLTPSGAALSKNPVLLYMNQ
jgi:hypothetical protein